MVIGEQSLFPAVRFFVMLPAEGNRIQPHMDDSFTIPTHADTVNMMHLCRAVADCTPAVFKAQIQVFSDIVCLGQQAILRWDTPVKTELNQVCNELSGRGHIAVRKGEPLPQAAGAEVPFQIEPKFFRFLPRPQRDITDNGKNLPALVCGNSSSIIQPDLNPPGPFLGHKPADIHIWLQD